MEICWKISEFFYFSFSSSSLSSSTPIMDLESLVCWFVVPPHPFFETFTYLHCVPFSQFFFVLISRSLQSLNIHPTSSTLQQHFAHSPERKARCSDFRFHARRFRFHPPIHCYHPSGEKFAVNLWFELQRVFEFLAYKFAKLRSVCA